MTELSHLIHTANYQFFVFMNDMGQGIDVSNHKE
jgi:hypothetical protein